MKKPHIQWPEQWLRRKRIPSIGFSYSGKDFIISMSLYTLSVVLCLILRGASQDGDTGYVYMIFLLDVFLTALLTEGFFFSLIISIFAVLSVDYIFTPPYWNVSFTLSGFPLTFLVTMTISVVTGIVAEYEENGTAIDRIEVSSSMTEKDLLWIIAINSAAYRQDLNAMSADLVRDFCKSSLSYFPTLGLTEDGGDGVVTTLTVKVKHLDPDELMDELGFNKDAKQWAGALYETLEQSDAINKYRTYYETYRPDHSGDGSFSGDVEYGTDYDNQIDISRFVDPGTKNNLDLAAYAVQAWENNWGYVWGTYGNILTESLFAYKKQQYPDGVGNYADFIEANWLGRRTADCIGLIKGYAWLDASTMRIGYAANGIPDYGADQMYQAAKNAGIQGTDYGTVSSMPEIPGLMLWKSGHAGVYIGGGYAIEAMGTRKGVVKTEVSGRGWQGWCKLPYIDYLEVE